MILVCDTVQVDVLLSASGAVPECGTEGKEEVGRVRSKRDAFGERFCRLEEGIKENVD
jgi:hypothetical protein